MEINKIENLNIAPTSIKSKEKLETKPQKNITSFSLDYCRAIKAKNMANIAFKGNREKSLEEKIAELKNKVKEKYPEIDKETIDIFFTYYVNEQNIDIAQKAFMSDRLPFAYAKGITKYTNSENEQVANYMVDSEDFPVENMEDALMLTNKHTSKTVLAACKNKNFPKNQISDVIANMKHGTDGAVQYLFMDDTLTPQLILEGINLIDYTNASFIEKLCVNNDVPANMLFQLIPKISNNPDEIEEFYNKLLSKGLSSGADISNALSNFNKANLDSLHEMLLLCEKYKFSASNTGNILSSTNIGNLYGRQILFDRLNGDDFLSQDEKAQLAKSVNNYNASYKVIVFDLIKNNPNFPREYVLRILSDVTGEQTFELSDKEYFEEFTRSANVLKDFHQQMLSNSHLYVNGEYENKEDEIDEINNYINSRIFPLIELASILDKDGLEVLFRQRLDGADEYIAIYNDFTQEDVDKLYDLVQLQKPNGEFLNGKDKLDCIDLMLACSCCSDAQIKLDNSIKSGVLDIEELSKEILLSVVSDCEIHIGEYGKHNEEELKKWELKYIPALAQEFYSMIDICDTSMIALIGTINAGENLFDFMHDIDNEFGRANILTMDKFKKAGLNYQAWVKPSKTSEVQFKYQDSNQEKLSQIVAQVEEDMNVLLNTPAKRFIEKNFTNCIAQDYKFKIPEKYSKNKQTMEEFLLKLYSVLDKNIFTRAQNSLSNDKKRENAQLTLTIKSHLEQRIEDIKKVENLKVVKPLDLTIKMWDRIPQKDLFQGNYSTCCIGMGKGNGRAMPHYILNTAFNMIEMVDNKTGKTIGNALCYFAKNNKNEIVFVVDNIEIANKNKPSSQAGAELRKTIVSYVQNILKEVCPNEDIKIYLGASYNDVPVEDLDEIDNKTSLYGDFDCSEIYLDAFGGWSDGKTNPKKETSLYCLN